MAKIDVSKIEGYAAMTAEQKIAALEGFDVQFDTPGFVKKDIYDKTAAELAKFKKEAGKQTEAAKSNEDRIAELEKQLKVSGLEKRYLASGYSAEDAQKAANALCDNDTDTLFELQNKNIEAVKKAAAADAMKQTPAPQNGVNTNEGEDDYSKKISAAQASGDFAAAAYYTRLQQQLEQSKES